MRELIVKSSSRVGDDFLNSIVIDLASILHAEHTFIGQLSDNNTRMDTVSYCVNGELVDNLTYPLLGTPCANVTGKEICVYGDGVASLFPDDKMLADFGIEGYVGVPLWSANGLPLGIIVSLFTSPIKDPNFAEAILQLFANRASNEIERKTAQKELEATRQKATR